MLASLLFYIFSAVLLASALGVIISRNPVYSVLFLILAFFNAAGLFILLGAEFLAMLIVIVYVGAVAVLFLFVIMMLNVNIAAMKEGFLKYLPVGVAVAIILFIELCMIIWGSIDNVTSLNRISADITNTQALGMVLYTDYILLFQIAGLILLVAMIGAIVLTHRQREGVKRQNIVTQLGRERRKTVKLVNVKIKEGVK